MTRIVTICEIDYDFCTWRYGEGDSNTAQHAWELDGDATDSAGSAHGTEIGSPTYQTAVFGQGAVCDESNYIETGLFPAYQDILDGFTLLAWIDLNTSNPAAIATDDIIAGLDVNFNISTSSVHGTLFSSGSGIQPVSLSQNTPYLVALSVEPFVKKNSKATISVDGGEVVSWRVEASSEPQDGVAGSPLKIGRQLGIMNTDGIYDRVRWYPFPISLGVLAQAASNVRAPGCQAVLGTSGPAKCFNTRVTCQDRDNYNRGVKTLRYKVPSGFGV